MTISLEAVGVDMMASGSRFYDPCPIEKKRPIRTVMIVVSVFGLIILVCGIVASLVSPYFIRQKVHQATEITSPKSLMYDAWVDAEREGIFMYRQFSFFNLTNPYEVINGSKPNFVLRGPYVYREVRRKLENSIRFYMNGSIGYQYTQEYFFVANMSIDTITGEQLSGSDIVTSPNIPLLGIAYRMSFLPTMLDTLISKYDGCLGLAAVLANQSVVGPVGLMVKRSVHEILWGYIDPVWASIEPLLYIFNYHASRHFFSEWNVTQPVPSPYSYRIGQRCPIDDNILVCNNTINLFTMEGSGKDGSAPGAKMGYLSQWAGQDKAWWWGPCKSGWTCGLENYPVTDPNQQPTIQPPDLMRILEETRPPGSDTPQPDPDDEYQCEEVTGSDGLRFGSNGVVTRDSGVTMWLDIFWRKMGFDYVQDTEFKGIEGYRFNVGDKELDNSERNRVCYQMERRGQWNFTQPIFGPVYAMSPFYSRTDFTDEELNFTMSRTWHDNETRYSMGDFLKATFGGDRDTPQFNQVFSSYLDLHPLTGVSLQARAYGQATTYLKPFTITGCEDIFADMNYGQNFPNTTIPLMLVNRWTEISDHWADVLKSNLRILNLVKLLITGAMVLGGLVLLVGSLLWLYEHRENQKRQRHIYPSTPLRSPAGIIPLGVQNGDYLATAGHGTFPDRT